MNKKIIIGSILVVTILLLMPSIPAIQNKTIEGKVFDNYIQNNYEMKMKELEEKTKNGFWEHPLFYLLAETTKFRTLRGLSMMFFSGFEIYPYGEDNIEHPILFLRGMWLYLTGLMFVGIIQIIADSMGWGWYK
jgi:hypothetical protein